VIVTFRHLRTVPGFGRKPGYCSSKSRVWFERHGFCWSDFLKNGIDAELLLATQDALAERLVAWARECEASA